MKRRSLELLGKAEGDLRTARRELRVTEEPSYDSVIFHAHQCAEKYLKACLTEWDLEVPRHHELDRLVDLVLDRLPLWTGLQKALIDLTAEFFEARYGHATGTLSIAQRCLEIALDIRQRCREALALND